MYVKQLVMRGEEDGGGGEGENVEEGYGEEGRVGVEGVAWGFLAKYRSHYENIESKPLS